MDNNSFPFSPFLEDDNIPISGCPDFTIWDVGVNQISYPTGSPQNVGGFDFRDDQKVEPCSVGVEVLISGDFMPALPVSRILQLLLEEGLVVVYCNWTKCDGSLHYLIQSEVLDYPSVSLPMLQRKLNGMINNLIDINK
ncbi:hypothetical protein PHJA_001981100 [Phtheirospermum japonicum]|uniref:Uncharacterized protein n=1 Tax=Phtheirospermum japonicum TaxID=374723 RepID=A0A830CJD7_9LAMI|nr:hypothetical protein PHJA_001981100 [Phtheirospermum japonicum]